MLIKRIPVDVGPFCDALEKLCGFYIFSHRFVTERGILHGVTLPRSWFVGLFRLRLSLDKNISYIRRFVSRTTEFLRRIDFQRENYNPQIPDNHQFKQNGLRLNPLYASVYIARMQVSSLASEI
jgi:hypothetical protein